MHSIVKELPSGFLIGADPELFVFNGDTPVSAHDMIPGSKMDPFIVPGGAVQPDGTAAEFNINPSANFEEFNSNIEQVLTSLRTFLPPGCELRAVPVVEWPEEYFSTLPYKATELGCMPDFDAWTGRRNPKPLLKNAPTLRTAAGHIHIGFTNTGSLQDMEHIAKARQMAQLMDWHVGVWSCSVDEDRIRRSLYGKAGACRYKNYGVEYRTLSNFWVLDEELRLEVWNKTCEACAEFDSGTYTETIPEEQEKLVAYINTGV